MADDAPRRFFVLTGGPGSGKSTLIDALRRAGYAGMGEAGRAIIQDQVGVGGPATPWGDAALYAELQLAWEMRSHRMAQDMPGLVFFDRGVPDVIGYLRLIGRPVPAHMLNAAETFRYAPRVFVAPPWPEIYAQDAERKQSVEEAARTYDAMVATYSSFGYELVELPRASVEERARFVVARIAT